MAGLILTYSYKNALGADNYWLELDIQKSLDFMGLRNFSLTFNGALIKSKVKFAQGSKEEDRAMQGQSPYLINTGVFYQHEKAGVSVAVLYNRIGKRIVGVGRNVGSGGESSRTIPNSYEMPRNTVDWFFCKKIGQTLGNPGECSGCIGRKSIVSANGDSEYSNNDQKT